MYDGYPGELPPDTRDEHTSDYRPKWMPKPRQLWALCLPGWHSGPVGDAYTGPEDVVVLPGGYTTSHFPWSSLSSKAKYAQGFPVSVVLDCGRCGKPTRHVPKGWRWATS